jgi:quercetin dioxygenase-like cupin family protein
MSDFLLPAYNRILTANALDCNVAAEQRGCNMDTDVGQQAVQRWDQASLESRVVRYRDLVPCTNAFIDTRTPGSDAKENFTIIGPGVAENPEQFVHITEAHGFNIGGARQPPRCINSQHSHDTAEVFVVHSGRWLFTFGEHGEDAQIEAGPGDIVSFPIHAFRGFENIGEDVGFLWSVLGGDDPGRVLWAPKVFELANHYGLMLLENGALIDTAAGQTPPPGVNPMPVTSPETIAKLRQMRAEDADQVIARATAVRRSGEQLVIGQGGELPPTEGFTVSRLWLEDGDASSSARRNQPEVIFVQSGEAEVVTENAKLTLGAGDTMTVPKGIDRAYRAARGSAELIVVRGTAS